MHFYNYIDIPARLQTSNVRRANKGEWDGDASHIPESWKGKWTVVHPVAYFSSFYEDRIITCGEAVYIGRVCNDGRCQISSSSEKINKLCPMIFTKKIEAELFAKLVTEMAFASNWYGMIGKANDWKNAKRIHGRQGHKDIIAPFVAVIKLDDYSVFSSGALMLAEREQAIKDGILKSVSYVDGKDLKTKSSYQRKSKVHECSKPLPVMVAIKNEWHGLQDRNTNKFMRFDGRIDQGVLVDDESQCTAFSSRYNAATALEAVEQLGWKSDYCKLRMQVTKLSSEVSEALEEKMKLKNR